MVWKKLIDCVINDTKVTLISKSMLSIATAMLLFTGCGSNTTKTTTDKNIIQPNPTQIEVHSSKTLATAGEAVDFYVSGNVDNIESYEWRDESGKLLTTKERFNRQFTKAWEYTTTLKIVDNGGKISYKTLKVKVTSLSESPVVPITPNQAPVVMAKSTTALHINSHQSIHLEDDGSYDPDGNIVSFQWRDMDGILLSETKVLKRKLYYYPQYDFNGDGTTRYIKTLIVTDNEGKSSSKSFEIIVHKLPNSIPIADTQSITMDEDSTKDITLTWSDGDGDVLTYSIVTQPSHGVLSASGADVSYTPNPNYYGSDSFSFKVNDWEADSNIAVINITIKDMSEPNQAPVPTFKTFTMDEDTTYNGMLTATDFESDALTFAKVSNPNNGTLSIDANGNFTYVPTANYNGSDTFTYSVSDAFVTTIQVVTVNITDIAELDTTPPIIILNGANTITLTVGDTYIEAGATANDDRDGVVDVTISGSVNTSIAGVYTITYTAVDSSDNGTQITREVIVNQASNQVPTANAWDDITITKWESVILNWTWADPDGNIVSYVWSDENWNIINENTISPETTTTYTLTVTDNNGATASDTMTVTVEEKEVNNPVEIIIGSDTTVEDLEVAFNGFDNSIDISYNNIKPWAVFSISWHPDFEIDANWVVFYTWDLDLSDEITNLTVSATNPWEATISTTFPVTILNNN